MSLQNIKALTCDTGGTVLDWHTGFREALVATQKGLQNPAFAHLLNTNPGICTPILIGSQVQFLNIYAVNRFIVCCKGLFRKYGRGFLTPVTLRHFTSERSLFV